MKVEVGLVEVKQKQIFHRNWVRQTKRMKQSKSFQEYRILWGYAEQTHGHVVQGRAKDSWGPFCVPIGGSLVIQK